MGGSISSEFKQDYQVYTTWNLKHRNNPDNLDPYKQVVWNRIKKYWDQANNTKRDEIKQYINSMINTYEHGSNKEMPDFMTTPHYTIGRVVRGGGIFDWMVNKIDPFYRLMTSEEEGKFLSSKEKTALVQLKEKKSKILNDISLPNVKNNKRLLLDLIQNLNNITTDINKIVRVKATLENILSDRTKLKQLLKHKSENFSSLSDLDKTTLLQDIKILYANIYTYDPTLLIDYDTPSGGAGAHSDGISKDDITISLKPSLHLITSKESEGDSINQNCNKVNCISPADSTNSDNGPESETESETDSNRSASPFGLMLDISNDNDNDNDNNFNNNANNRNNLSEEADYNNFLMKMQILLENVKKKPGPNFSYIFSKKIEDIKDPITGEKTPYSSIVVNGPSKGQLETDVKGIMDSLTKEMSNSSNDNNITMVSVKGGGKHKRKFVLASDRLIKLHESGQ